MQKAKSMGGLNSRQKNLLATKENGKEEKYEQHAHWLPITNWSFLKIFMFKWRFVDKDQADSIFVFRNIYVRLLFNPHYTPVS